MAPCWKPVASISCRCIEALALPADIAASTNPKSSTGRLDVFTRVIADETRGFDRVEPGYRGPLYAEISPKTFPVLVREGSRLSQIRFRRGDAALNAEALRALHAHERLVDRAEAVMGDGVAVSVDLSGGGPAQLPRKRRSESEVALSVTAPSVIPPLLRSSAAPPMTLPISGSRSPRAPTEA